MLTFLLLLAAFVSGSATTAEVTGKTTLDKVTVTPTMSPTNHSSPTLAPTNTTNTTTPKPTIAPTNSTTPPPTPPTNHTTPPPTPSPTNNTTPPPTPAPTNGTTPIPTNAPTNWTLSPTTTPTMAPTRKRSSFGKIVARTTVWLILLVLSTLAFGAVMSNRVHIYYIGRGVWYTVNRWECTRKLRRMLRFGRDDIRSDSSINDVIFYDDNDLTTGLMSSHT